MKKDLQVERAIRSGERNKEVVNLIQNWCAHARIQKFGGVGIIEIQTGLPIGHHGMACEHASGGSMGSWDLADAAIDFYDQNCSACTKRLAVRMPNLNSLVAERDAHVKKLEDEQDASQVRLANALMQRSEHRQSIRSRQTAESVSILDFIDDIDRKLDGKLASEKLVGAAKLAPETFSPEITAYCFSLIENREQWFNEVGLEVLSIIAKDIQRLVKSAMLCLSAHEALPTACDVVQSNPSFVDPSQISAALPALVWRAEPEQTSIRGNNYVYDPRALVAVYEHHTKDVTAAIESALSDRRPYVVSLGARAIIALSTNSSLSAHSFTRSIVAKLARAHLLMDERETSSHDDDEAIVRLQDALVLALADNPDAADEVVGKFLASVSSEGEVRIYRAYVAILNPRRGWRDEPITSHPASRHALRRLIAAVTTSNEYEVLCSVRDAFAHLPESTTALALRERSTLLGTALQLDDRISGLYKAPPATDMLAHMERDNLLQLLMGLQRTLVIWAADSVVGNSDAREEFLDLLRKIPEGKERMRGVLVENLHRLMHTPEGLKEALPELYGAMMHSSTVVRASAASALRELSRTRQQDLPDLLYEAFVMHLSDPYVMVHQTAANGLDRTELPESLKPQAANAVLSLIEIYARDKENERFLVKCIELYLRQFATPMQKQGGLGRILVALLGNVKPDLVAKDLYWLARDLGTVEGFSGLVVKALSNQRVSEYQQEDVLRALNTLAGNSIRMHIAELVAIGSAVEAHRELPPALVETLTRAGAWAEAAKICETVHNRILDTVENRFSKLYSKLHLIAAQFEASIAAGRMSELSELASTWKETEFQIKHLHAENEKRRNSFPSLSRPYRRG